MMNQSGKPSPLTSKTEDAVQSSREALCSRSPPAPSREELGLLFTDALQHRSRQYRRLRELPAPLISALPNGPAPLWYRVCSSAYERRQWVTDERHKMQQHQRKLEKCLKQYHEEAQSRAERERLQQRTSRALIASRLHISTMRFWARRGDMYEQALQQEFLTVKQHYDQQRQEDLLAETEALTKKLVSSMVQKSSLTNSPLTEASPFPLASFEEEGGNDLLGESSPGSASAVPLESHLALLNTLDGARPLRSYQRSALKWLIHLYDNRLNGILADEMGLGKTVQTIALLCYYAQYRNDWGPHLIVVPTTVVLNWKEELERWAPGLKVITYVGGRKERKLLRKGWDKEDAFHVCVTSYNTVLIDRPKFRRRAWGFLVLDEAHQIKNFMSQKWRALFDLQAEYRLLLTGTPLQNSIMELWSLFHFLLPRASAFQSPDEFREWFSNPLDDMVSGRSSLNESIVRRLQALLRPFMLRRLKRDVESQLPTKTEKVVMCRLSRRQRALYDDYMQLSDTKRRIQKGGIFSVLLALRKVCNHPDLFEERPTISPLVIDRNYSIEVLVPRRVLLQDQLFRYRFPQDKGWLSVACEVRDLHMNEEAPGEEEHDLSSVFEWLPCRWLKLQWVFGAPIDVQRYSPEHFPLPCDSAALPTGSTLLSATLLHMLHRSSEHVRQNAVAQARYRTRHHFQPLRYQTLSTSVLHVFYPASCGGRAVQDCLAGVHSLSTIDASLHITRREWSESFEDLCPSGIQRFHASLPWIEKVCFCVPKAIPASPPQLRCSLPIHRPQCFEWSRASCAPLIAWAGRESERLQGRTGAHPRDPLAIVFNGSHFLKEWWPLYVRRSFSFPDRSLIIHDCGKLQHLEKVLKQLKSEGHRVLLFTQFVRMLDILERFLAMIGIAYLRLDGATKAEERQAYTNRFNSDSRITAMILSTRSGGIGLNLTGADTVIFYDTDWNPTIDLQAQDRCHRIGQTRPVTIFRLISAHTVEEHILAKSQERKKLNNVVIRAGHFNAIASIGSEAAGEADDDAVAAAWALLSAKTDLRSFFHSRDEDTVVEEDDPVPSEDATLLNAMRSAEDAEDREALTQLEAEMQAREREDKLDGEEERGAPLDGEELGVACQVQQAIWDGEAQGNERSYVESDVEGPELRLYQEEPMLRSIAIRRQKGFLKRCRNDVDRQATACFGIVHPADARKRYQRLCDTFQEKINRPDTEMPPWRRRLE